MSHCFSETSLSQLERNSTVLGGLDPLQEWPEPLNEEMVRARNLSEDGGRRSSPRTSPRGLPLGLDLPDSPTNEESVDQVCR